jgi:hypothetical protein
VEDILASVDQQLKEKVEETKLGLQTVMISLNMQTKSLREMIKECRKRISMKRSISGSKEHRLGHRPQGASSKFS